MKKVVLAALIMCVSAASFGQKYITHTGKVIFDATTPKSPEKISGINNEVGSMMDGKSGAFVFQVPVKSFKFEKALMKEHFDENYMESDKFPKADFNGKVSDMANVNMAKEGTYNVTVAGKLTIHGVTKEVSVPGTLTVKGKDIEAKAKFEAKLADYNISVPSIVSDKLAKEATITVDVLLNQK